VVEEVVSIHNGGGSALALLPVVDLFLAHCWGFTANSQQFLTGFLHLPDTMRYVGGSEHIGSGRQMIR